MKNQNINFVQEWIDNDDTLFQILNKIEATAIINNPTTPINQLNF